LYSPIIHTICFSQTPIHGISDNIEQVATVEQLKWAATPFPLMFHQSQHMLIP
jgi:hypothetical protein